VSESFTNRLDSSSPVLPKAHRRGLALKEGFASAQLLFDAAKTALQASGLTLVLLKPSVSFHVEESKRLGMLDHCITGFVLSR
jgi:hypothetical protein